MQDNEKKPALRFKGFTDPWEQRKVGELLTERNEQAPMSDEYPLMAFIANEGVAPKGERYDRSALVNDTASKLYKKTKFGDFIYSSNNLETGSIGLNKYGKASISPVYSIFKPTGIADSDFLGRRLIRKDFINEMVKWRQGVIYGQWRIHESDFIKIEVTVPTVEEQYKLGLLLDNLDTLITLHQRRYEKLVNIKKSMLDKMFPKNGASVPEIRFKGFTDLWEQRKLVELTKTITTGKSVNSDEGEVSDGDIGVLKTSCVSYDRFNPSESKPVVKSEQQLVKCAVEKDSVIVSRMNTPERVGACGYVSTDFPNLFLPDRLWKLKFQDTVDTYFVYMMLVSSAYKEKITSMASGTSGSMYNIPKETFLNLQLVIPAKIDEQKQLGKILKKIDTLITLHQRKLEKLQNIKKSCLEKMFV